MKDPKLIKSEIIYCVPIPKKDFIRLLEQNLNRVEEVKNIPDEYGDHCGLTVYVPINTDYNDPDLKELIIKTIGKHSQKL